MNERLKELMLEAGYAAPELAGRAQQLAELIVRECCAIADQVERADMDSYVSKYIRAHFGVEE
jgi:hypothetical protein